MADKERVEVKHPLLGGFQFEVTMKAAGRKSSEGDGRTAADIEAEQRARQKKET